MKKINLFNINIELVAIFLMVITAIIITWHHFGMNKSFIIDADSDYISWADNDKEEGGNSEAIFTKNTSYNMHCSIKATIRGPFCNLFIRLAKDNVHGIDLSIYQNLHLTFDYQSTLRDSMNISLNHFNSTKTSESRFDYYKPNQQSLNPKSGTHTYTLKLSDFYVASWWVFLNKSRLNDSSTNLTNAMDLVLSTGANNTPHEVDIRLMKIEFTGKWIKAEILYLYILLIWIALIFLYAIKKTYTLNQTIAKQRLKTQELESLNRELDNRSKHLEYITKHDSLTGAYNLDGMKDSLSNAINEKRTKRIPLSVLLIEPDYLHRISDQLGLDLKDTLLRNLAELIRSKCKPEDDLVRWSENEFLVICKNTDIHEAAQQAQQLCRDIRATKLLENHNITCSIGAAELQKDDINELFKQADAALSRAKQMGRNRSAIAN